MRRNLLFHMYPYPCEMLHLNLERLARYWNVFNGRKIIHVATDENSVRAAEAESLLQQHGLRDYELLFNKNDPKLFEAVFFVDLLRMLKSIDPEEATFFCHSKGASSDIFERRGTTFLEISTWAGVMYKLCLEDPSRIDELMRKYAVVGTYRCSTDKTMPTPWYFAGTFYWFNHQAVYSRQWDKRPNSRFACEEYPGNMFPIEQSFNLGGPRFENVGNLYKPEAYQNLTPEERAIL